MEGLRELGKKIVLILGVILLSFYVYFRIQYINLTPVIAIFSIIVFLAESHTILHLFGMFYNLWPRNYDKWEDINYDRNLRINLLICVCGEPTDIVRNTIQGAKNAADTYTKTIKPVHRPQVVVLNDGYVADKDNWQEIEQLAENMGVRCITRQIPGGFKAGNINNALKTLETPDPHNTLDVVFDSDFKATDEFLLEMTKPFKNPKIDFVQSPQRYQNEQSWVAKGAAAHQIFFFDHVCPATGYNNALFLCGTNFMIRREALNSVGGMDTRFITEDYATSLELHMKGKRGVFMPKVLAYGMAPESLKAYFSQQQRWSKGNFDVTRAYFKHILFGPLTLKQKFHYLVAATYYLIGLRDLILILAPIPYLFFGISPIKPNTINFLLLIYGPYLIYNFVMFGMLFREPLKSIVLDVISFPVFVRALVSSILGKRSSFVVTIKKYQKENVFNVYRVQLVILAVLAIGLYYSITHSLTHYLGGFFNYFWATFDTTILALGFYLIFRENYHIQPIEDFIFKPLDLLFRWVKFSGKVLVKPAFALAVILLITNSTSIYTFATEGSPNLFLANTIKQQKLVIPENGAYYGYYLPSLNTHPKDPEVGVISGEKPSLVMFYQEWGSEPQFDLNFMNALSNQNVVPVITWEPWDPSKGDPVKGSTEQTQYSPKAIASGQYDSYIHQWAREAAAYRKPFFLRFAHEMNGNWYPWGDINGNTPDDYIKMWIHVYNIFQEEHANNVMWIWAPNATDADGNRDSIVKYYPGDQYVDWVGFSGFNWGTSNPGVTYWNSFKSLAYDTYTILSNYHKPIMVAETSSSSAGGLKYLWFEQTLSEDIPTMPNIKAVIFFNDDFKMADFTLTTNMNADYVITNYITDNKYYIKNPAFVT
ncbi:MAG: glycosyltransferase [Firmicutes bacterium]|nr:glycosyltransferase [Bacillota bacterium]